MTDTADITDDTTFSIDDWISGASRPETVITLSSKGKEYGQFQALEQELLAANKAAADDHDDRLVSGAAAEPRRIAEQMDALAKVIEKGRRPFRLRGLCDDDLKAVRVSAKDADEDAANELLLSVCCIEPTLSPAQWKALRNAVGEGQWVQTLKAANEITFGPAMSVPFSVAASVVRATDKS